MKNVSFLIADDSPSIRSVVKSTIYDQLGSQRILSAVNGLTAKLILQKQAVDIIISDLDMPHLDGFQLLSFVRSHSKLKDTPFIMMTSEDSKESVVDAIQKGVTQYLVKPFTSERLEEAIRRAWYGSEQRRSARITDLPPHSLEVSFDLEKSKKGSIKNLSKTGILIELPYSDEIKLFAKCRVAFKFSLGKRGTFKVTELVYNTVRIETADYSTSSNTMCHVAVNLDADASQQESINQLTELMDILTLEGVKHATVEQELESLDFED
ncbi:response regulator [Marinomonas sp. THO17]|uniref:response regulator n=1 Tax=Marinomonas sp. THO17 TaxID=3149048 RepID=UPI00336BFF0B